MYKLQIEGCISVSYTHLSLLAGCLASCKVFQKRIVANVLDHAGNWLIEQQPNGSVAIGNGKMEIVDAKGCTVWLKQKLKGDVRIQYDVTVIQNNVPFARVSDLNCFWMANDPGYHNDFFAASEKRAGLFPNCLLYTSRWV